MRKLRFGTGRAVSSLGHQTAAAEHSPGLAAPPDTIASAPTLPTPAGLPTEQLARLMESRARAARAHAALSGLLSGPACAALVEALVAKYVALSAEELEEWRDDPESYARWVCGAKGTCLGTVGRVDVRQGLEARSGELLKVGNVLQGSPLGPERLRLGCGVVHPGKLRRVGCIMQGRGSGPDDVGLQSGVQDGPFAWGVCNWGG